MSPSTPSSIEIVAGRLTLVCLHGDAVLVTILRKYELRFGEDYLSKVEKTNLEGEESAMYLTSLTLPMVSLPPSFSETFLIHDRELILFAVAVAEQKEPLKVVAKLRGV